MPGLDSGLGGDELRALRGGEVGLGDGRERARVWLGGGAGTVLESS